MVASPDIEHMFAHRAGRQVDVTATSPLDDDFRSTMRWAMSRSFTFSRCEAFRRRSGHEHALGLFDHGPAAHGLRQLLAHLGRLPVGAGVGQHDGRGRRQLLTELLILRREPVRRP
jgi:hypothetical protein